MVVRHAHPPGGLLVSEGCRAHRLPGSPQSGLPIKLAVLRFSMERFIRPVRAASLRNRRMAVRPCVPDVRTVEITLARLPAGLDGLRVVQLSDLHASRLLQAPWVRAVVEKTNALNPDLILITGGLIDGTPECAADVLPLQNLWARQGVFAIPGNHEYYASNPQWLSAFGDLGMRMLLNGHVVINERAEPGRCRHH